MFIRLCLRVIDMIGLMIQICLNCNPLNLVVWLFKVIIVKYKNHVTIHPTETH